jgi:hypothetical protein
LKKLKTVVVMCGLNDMLKALARPNSTPTLDQNIEDSLYKSSFTHTARFGSGRRPVLFQFIKNSLRNIKADTAGQALQDLHGDSYKQWRKNRNNSHERIDRIDSASLQIAVSLFDKNMKGFIQSAQKQHLKILLIGQAAAWRDTMSYDDQSRLWMGGLGKYQLEQGHPYYSPKVLSDLMHYYNLHVQNICKQENVPFIDISTFPTDINHIYDDCHFTQRGARELADTLFAHWPLR